MEVGWLERALSDLDKIQDYIEADNPAAAQAICRRIDTKVRLLGEQPSLGRAGRVPGTRELVISGTPYIAAYKVIDERVVVVAVLHGARQWPRSF